MKKSSDVRSTDGVCLVSANEDVLSSREISRDGSLAKETIRRAFARNTFFYEREGEPPAYVSRCSLIVDGSGEV